MPAHIKYPVIDGMKQCCACGQWKPITEYNKNRKRFASRCRVCSSAYAAEYRERPEVKVHQLAYTREYRKDAQHRLKQNANSRKSNQRPERKLRRNATRRVWTAIEKQKAVDYKGGECCICGYSACLAALDFHHIDPTEKEGYGTGALKSHWSFERNKPEIDKCILVCVRCHREIHAGMHPEWIKS